MIVHHPGTPNRAGALRPDRTPGRMDRPRRDCHRAPLLGRGGSTDRPGLRVSLASQVAGPVVHEPTSAVE